MAYSLEGPKWGGGSYGTPATVRWSFADLDIERELGRTYPNYPDFLFTIGGSFREEVRAAFGAWDAVADIDFVEVADSTASNIRLGERYIDGSPAPGQTTNLGIATYYFTDDVFTHAAISFDTDAFRDADIFYWTAVHEIGHAIGLGHSDTPDDVMFTTLNEFNRDARFSSDDIAGLQFLYGRETGDGNDRVAGTSADELLHGFGGNDVIDGQAGNDLIFGDGGDDRILGGLGNDDLRGWFGNDVLFGELGNDYVFGEENDDFIGAGAGNDFASGGEGNDQLFGEEGSDVVFGDSGRDLVNGGAGNDEVRGGQGSDILFGESGDDVLLGEEENDFIGAGSGNDVLSGGAGVDSLYGEDGNDILLGNAGDDDLNGGFGSDIFVFGRGDGRDRVADFDDPDVLEFNGGVFGSFAAVQAASRQVGADLVITLDQATSVTLADVQLGDLGVDQVRFA